jgi:hypothetical protein
MQCRVPRGGGATRGYVLLDRRRGDRNVIGKKIESPGKGSVLVYESRAFLYMFLKALHKK